MVIELIILWGVVVVELTRIIKSVVTGQAPVTLELWKALTPRKGNDRIT